MKKIWLVFAICLCIFGIALFFCAMASLNFDFTKLSTEAYEINTYEINEEFVDIFIDENVSEIEFRVAKDDNCKVVCCEEEKTKHNVYIKDFTLIVEIDDKREWYDYIGISLGSPKITIYLTDKEYNTLNIATDTGDVNIPDSFRFETIKIKSDTSDIISSAATKTIDIKTSTGKVILDGFTASDIVVTTSTGGIEFYRVKCMTIEIKASTGDIYLEEVAAIRKLFVTTSTGDVIFKDSDAGEIKVKTSTGDVKGNLLRDKIFITETSTGKINVPLSKTGEICKITTSTGDIKFKK